MKRSTTLFLVGAVAFFLFVPWLGVTDFYSKGEPREAIVAVSMLESGDWILPVSYGSDIPYKPPLLAWLIAAFSWMLNGGVVNEFTSRLPSAVAAIAMLVAGFRLVSNRCGSTKAWVMMLLTATSFEVFRAAAACRVDMVLTACMVGAIYAMFTMRGHPLRYLWAVLLLSGAVLTKGPVGSLLPCLAMGLYFLLRGDNFWRTLFTLSALCLASFILPALWYYAAYLRGGQEFFDLAWEENIGRLTGTMSYDSHLNPWYYNVITVLAGMLPWTPVIIIALCYRRVRGLIRGLSLDRGLPLMAWTVGLTVFIFYCFPASKRSVYLLPCYPFLAYGATWVIMQVSHTRLMRVWAFILAVLGIVAPVIMWVASRGVITGLKVAEPEWWQWFFFAVPVIAGIWWLFTRSIDSITVKSPLAFTYMLYVCYSAAFMPMVLNPMSDIRAAEKVREAVPANEPIVTVIDYDDLLRYYGMNFYLNDRLRRVPTLEDVPDNAWAITAPTDGIEGDTLTARSRDTGRAAVLVAPRAR